MNADTSHILVYIVLHLIYVCQHWKQIKIEYDYFSFALAQIVFKLYVCKSIIIAGSNFTQSARLESMHMQWTIIEFNLFDYEIN